MATMSSAAAARLGLRSASLLRGARMGLKAKLSNVNAPPSIRLRFAVETTSFCVESLLPMHGGATASALMISMLSLSRSSSSSASCGWLYEGS